MTGTPHINRVINKCDKNINILRTLSGAWWGAHPFAQKLLYNALVRSQLDYGCIILEPCSQKDLHKLNLIQSKSLRIVAGAMKSSPINALQVECGEPPLHLRRQLLADRYLYKAAQLSNHPLIPKLELLSRFTITKPYWRFKEKPRLVNSFNRLKSLRAPTYSSQRLPAYNFSYETLIFKPQIDHMNISKKTLNANTKFDSIVNKKWSDWNYIFTDASKVSDLGCVGSAFYHQNTQYSQSCKSPPQSSVFTGECVAVFEAVLYIYQNKLQHTVIFTDCLSTIQALLQNPLKSKTGSHIIMSIKDTLLNCSNDELEIVFTWIPSHVGIVGNELVDSLAKRAIISGDRKNFIIHSYDLLAVAKTRLSSSWDSYWRKTSRTKGRYLASIQPDIPSKPWFSRIKNLSKTVTSIICRLRIGHNCLPVHLSKLRIRDSSLCECGLDVGDVDHTFFVCPKYNKNNLYKMAAKLKIPLPVNVKYLLTFPHRNVIYAIANFVKVNEIKI